MTRKAAKTQRKKTAGRNWERAAEIGFIVMAGVGLAAILIWAARSF